MFVEHLPTFLVDFGVDCMLDGRLVRAVFDNGYTLASPLGSVGIAASGPMLTLATSDVPTQPDGLIVTALDDASWRIVEHQPDGTGISVLILERML